MFWTILWYDHGKFLSIMRGANVYLRRILEHLIEDAHQRALTNPEWDEKTYKEIRVDKKIQMLEHEFSAHSLECLGGLHSILSKGIHQLSDEECSKHFILMKCAIISILDEKMYKSDTEKLNVEIRKNINKVRSELR